MAGFDFLLNLQDNVSGAAKLASTALGALSGNMSDLAKIGEMAAEAVLKVASAIIDLGIKGAETALEVTEMRNQLAQTFEALGEAPGAGKKTLDMLDKMSSKLPQTTQQLGAWATQLEGAGINSLPQLEKSLKAVASAQALMGSQGDTAAKKVTKLLSGLEEAAQLHKPFQINAKTLQGTGVTVADIAAKMNIPVSKLQAMMKHGIKDTRAFSEALQEALIQNGQAPLEAMGDSFSNIGAKFKDSIGNLFKDVNPKPFLEALKSLVGVFDQNSASGQAMRSVVTTVFNTIFNVAAKVFPYIKAAIKQVIIEGLRIAIAFKPAVKAFQDLFKGSKDGQGMATMLQTIHSALAPIAFAVKNVVGAFVGFVKIYTYVSTTIDSVKAKISAGMAAVKALLSGGGSEGASGFINGLLGGIHGGTGPIIDAIRALGSSAIDTLKSVLHIGSPSKVMAQMGGHTAQGFAQGIEGGGKDVDKAMAKMAQPTPVATSNRTSNSKSIHLGGITLNISGVKGADELKDMLPSVLSQALEQLALQRGG